MLIIPIAIIGLASGVLLPLSIIMVAHHQTYSGTQPIKGKEKTWRTIRLISACCFVTVTVFSLLVLPPFSLLVSSPGRRSPRIECLLHLKRLHLAVLLYQDDYNIYPQRLSQLAPYSFGYVNNVVIYDDKVFTCPVKKHRRTLSVAKVDEHTNYLYRPPTTEGDTLPILADKLSNHWSESVNMAFADGHVEMKEITPETIALMSEAFGDTVVMQEYVNYLNPSPFQTQFDITINEITDSIGVLLLLLFFFGSITVHVVVGLKIRRYEKKYKNTPDWEKPKALYTILVICQWMAVLWLLLWLAGFLLSMLLPAL